MPASPRLKERAPLFLWDRHPEAIAYLERYHGYWRAERIAAGLARLGYPGLDAMTVYNKASRLGLDNAAPGEELDMAKAARLLGVSCASLTYWLDRFALRRRGLGRGRFLPVPVMDVLCAVYRVESPHLPGEMLMTGRPVTAAYGLRATFSSEATYLVPAAWSKAAQRGRVTFAYGQGIGTVRALYPGCVEVATAYGCVLVAPSAVVRAQPEGGRS